MKTTYYVAATLDGFIAQPDGGVAFLDELPGEPDSGPYESFFATVDALAMGRRTFDQLLTFGEWPYGKRSCTVLTTRGLDHPSLPVAAASGDARSVHAGIAERGAKHLWLVGGAEVASQFLAAGLLDAIVVSTVPVLLGDGIPLFSSLPGKITLSVNQSERHANGIIETTYTPIVTSAVSW